MNHIMSVENHLSEPAEPVSVGKGQRSQPKSNSPADATSDGVFVDGMAGNDTEISREICSGGAKASTTASSLSAGKSGRAGAEVGAAGSSVDLWDTTTHGERSGSACIQATKRSEGSGDGPGKSGIGTPNKIRKLQIKVLGTDKLYKKPVDAGVFRGDRLPHEDGEAVGGGGCG
jgi:hypothetical protein